MKAVHGAALPSQSSTTSEPALSDVAEQIRVALQNLTSALQCIERQCGAACGGAGDEPPCILLPSGTSMTYVSCGTGVTPQSTGEMLSPPFHVSSKWGLSFKEMLAKAEEAIGQAHILEPQMARAFLESNPDTLFLDVQDECSPWVPGTYRVSLGRLFEKASSGSLSDPVVADRRKDAPILVTCSTGRQAKLGAKLLMDYGFTNVRTVDGGWEAWKEASMSHPLTLPSGWPQTIERRRGLSGLDHPPSRSLSHGPGRSMILDEVGVVATPESDKMLVVARSSTSLGLASISKRSWFVLSPASALRLSFDLLSLIALSFDLVMVPWLLAWEVQVEGWLRVCSLVLAVFWSVDIFASFRTGFYMKGEVVMSPASIATRYVKTWFFPDFIMVALDWASIVFLSPEGVSGTGTRSDLEMQLSSIFRFTKWSRFLRLAGVARFIRFSDNFQRISDWTSQSPNALVFFQTFRLLFVVLYVNHVGACVWWAIGRDANSNTGARWVNLDDEFGFAYRDGDRFYQYVISLHWAVTQILAGSMQINAVNTAEHLFSVTCLIFGVLFFSSLVSMLTSRLTQMRVVQQDRTAKLRQLREFLRTKGVNTELAVNITKQVGEAIVERKPHIPSDLQVWHCFSQAHKTELHRELCRPYLIRHPFFMLVAHIEAKVIRKLCDKALTMTVHSPQDLVLTPGNKISEAYMVINGVLRYIQDEETSMVTSAVVRTIREGAWICEAALWTSWVSVGTLEAAAMCELLVVNADKMVEVFQRNVHVCQLASEYSQAFCTRVRAAKPPAAELPSDASLPFASHAEIMASLSSGTRAFAACMALKSLGPWRPFSLPRDISEGKHTAVITPSGDVELVSVLAAVRLVRQDGKVLSQLGVWDGEVAQPACQLPTTQLQEGEVPCVAAQRVLREQLAPMAQHSSIKNVYSEEAKRQEGELTLRTEYEAYLEDDLTPVLAKAGHAWGREMSRISTRRWPPFGSAVDELFVVSGVNEEGGNELRLLCWLEPEHLKWLSNSSGQVELRKFLSSVSVTQAAADDAFKFSNNPQWRSTASSASSETASLASAGVNSAELATV